MSEKITTSIAYAGSAVTTVAGYTLNEWAAIFGIGLGAATFIYNVYHKREMRRILEKHHHVRISDG